MKTKLAITGLTGFVGQNLMNYLDLFKIKSQGISREALNNSFLDLLHGTYGIVHLAGKAHDLKNTATPDEYYYVNTELTRIVFDEFLISEAEVFITLSSVKAVADEVVGILTEDHIPNPISHYGKSKLLAEQYIFSKEIPQSKRVYVLRPCMVHGPGNRGNLNLLFSIISNGYPWPLGLINNKRSFCSIENLCFVIKELIHRDDIPSGVYNIADDESVSTNDLIILISKSLGKTPIIWKIPLIVFKIVAKIGDILNLPISTERLTKLTESYVVSNQKLISAMGQPLPIKAKEGLFKTFNSFNNSKGL